MHQLARKVSRDKEKKVTYKELCKRLLVTRRAENFETYLNINQPLKIEGKTYSEVRTVDKQLLHATRDTKVALGKTLPLEELLQRYKQDLLSFDEWRIDKTNSSIVTVITNKGNGWERSIKLDKLCYSREEAIEYIKSLEDKEDEI